MHTPVAVTRRSRPRGKGGREAVSAHTWWAGREGRKGGKGGKPSVHTPGGQAEHHGRGKTTCSRLGLRGRSPADVVCGSVVEVLLRRHQAGRHG